MSITEGDTVRVVNARGESSERIALTRVVAGRDFPVVWVAFPDEVALAASEDRSPDGVPWPAEDVSALAAVTV